MYIYIYYIEISYRVSKLVIWKNETSTLQSNDPETKNLKNVSRRIFCAEQPEGCESENGTRVKLNIKWRLEIRTEMSFVQNLENNIKIMKKIFDVRHQKQEKNCHAFSILLTRTRLGQLKQPVSLGDSKVWGFIVCPDAGIATSLWPDNKKKISHNWMMLFFLGNTMGTWGYSGRMVVQWSLNHEKWWTIEI